MFADFLGRLSRDRRGNVALIFALCLIPVVLFIGVAVDLGNAQRVRAQLQDATDSAVLAVARDGLRLTDAQLKVQANTYLKASYRYSQVPYTITKLTFDRTTVTAVLDTSARVPTSFMQIAGFKTVPITTHAISKGLGFEIAMVLDTSGSMNEYAGSTKKIDALKTASESFLTSMFGTSVTSQRVAIAVVPFATTVRVMPAGTTVAPSWLDTTGAAANAFDDFDSTSISPWAMFSKLSNTKWGGCVMTRTGSTYDVDDTAPSGSALFRPWFWPDEPDTDHSEKTGTNWYGQPTYASYANNYIDDSGGTCGGDISGASRNTTYALKYERRSCKYKSAIPKAGYGPNLYCDTAPITALTNTRSTLDAAIDALSPTSNTNILEGLMWGWRVLSPTEPFTQGKPYSAGNNRKVIILMTDGQNNYGGDGGNQNYSTFFTYGYARYGRIGVTTSDNNTLNAKLDAKTLTACANAKAKGILIYTIGFGSGATGSQSLLRSCASDPTYFYQPATSADLQPVFIAIAESINRLRIAE